MIPEEIEKLEFEQIGEGCYKLKHIGHIQGVHAQLNIFGLIRIDNNFYKKEYFDKYGQLNSRL